MSLIFSIGKWGGFYVHIGYTFRICLGWVAITFVPQDIDFVLQENTLYRAMLETPRVQAAIAEQMLKGPQGGDFNG